MHTIHHLLHSDNSLFVKVTLQRDRWKCIFMLFNKSPGFMLLHIQHDCARQKAFASSFLFVSREIDSRDILWDCINANLCFNVLVQIGKNYHVKSIGSDNFIYIGDVIQMILPIKMLLEWKEREREKNTHTHIHTNKRVKMVCFAHFASSYCDVCACCCIIDEACEIRVCMSEPKLIFIHKQSKLNNAPPAATAVLAKLISLYLVHSSARRVAIIK